MNHQQMVVLDSKFKMYILAADAACINVSEHASN
jgi:hypothetical protein